MLRLLPRLSPRLRNRLLCLAALCTGAWALVALALELWGRHRPPPRPADAIVVLGCHVDRGGVPSPALAGRTRRAVELWRSGLAPLLIFTGGVGTYGPSEASVAADLAVSLGVPRSSILLEERSTNTRLNAAEARRLTSARRVLIVSDAYHLFRSRQIFARHFDEVQVTGVLGTVRGRVVGSLREVISVSAWLLVTRWLPA